jgi:nucleotide-binding universal stress UspA family protein
MGNNTSAAEGKPVLVALDLSERSSSCIAQGCELAAKFGRPLILVHVVHEAGETTGMYRSHHKARDTLPLRDIAKEMLEEQLAAFRAGENGSDFSCDIRLVVVEGVPETRLIELAEHFDASMIVMRSHNRSGLRRWLYGSVTESVVRRAPCPVVVVGNHETPFVPLTVHRPRVGSPPAAQGA